jgi:S-adenosylmethionine:tRNA ribosyltransferase-isomerase
MASAGRPFTESLLTRLVARGIGVAPITLHTGVSSQEAGEGPQPEWYDVPAATARLVELTRESGGRVVATGTTVTRALESAVQDGHVDAATGWTGRVVTPADPPVVVDGLVTGWHDAGASHLLLVEAVAGATLGQAAYDEALAEGYRWHEFGDSALFLP